MHDTGLILPGRWYDMNCQIQDFLWDPMLPFGSHGTVELPRFGCYEELFARLFSSTDGIRFTPVFYARGQEDD